ncbi:MFS transporter [Streptomyces sp. NPDC091280]|uniref:MFS transporter n=1 Tax=Streptomyces sp. NPDC091280 TaxID=3365984 RepID=UPI0038240866
MTDARTAADRRGRAFALLAMTQFAVVLDITIVTVALPSIETSLGFSRAGLAWVVDAYLLTFGGFLLLGGRAADLFGRKRVFLGGLALFGLASLACGLAVTGGQLVAARAAQGLGGAVLSPAALSLVAVTYPQEAERNRAMGIWGAVAGAGGATGVVLGGLLTHGLGWQWVFWVNVPLTLGGALLGIRLITDADPGRGAPWREFDVLGALTVTAGLSALLYGLIRTGEHGVGSPLTVSAYAAALALLGAFAVVELRVPVPLIDFAVFRSRTLSAANGMMLAFMAGVVATNFFVTLYAQQVLGYGPVGAGLSLLPLALGQVLFARLAPHVSTRLGLPGTLLAGMAAAVAGFGWFALLRPDGSFTADILGPALLVSVGGGFGFVVLIVLAVSDVAPHRAGLAGGLINMSQQLGGALGLAVLASLATWYAEDRVHHGTPLHPALTDGFRLGFLAAAVLVLAAALGTALALRARATTARTPAADTPSQPVPSP